MALRLKPIKILITVAIFLLWCLCGWAAFRFRWIFPFADDWDIITPLVDHYYKTGSLSWSQIFDQHNEHRIALLKLVFFVDQVVFGGRNLFSVFVSFAAQTLSFVLIYRWIERLDFKESIKGLLQLIVAGLLFSTSNALDYSREAGIYLCYALALSSLAVLRRSVWASVLFAALASYSMGQGVWVWPCLLLFAVLERFSKRKFAIIIVVGAGVLISYFYSFEFPAHHYHPLKAGVSLTAISSFLIYFLGNCFYPVLENNSPAMGLLAIIWSLILLYKILESGKFRSRDSDFNFGLVGFVYFLGVASVAAMTRWGFGQDFALDSRYAITTIFVWVFLISLTLIVLKGKPVFRLIGLGFFGILLVPNLLGPIKGSYYLSSIKRLTAYGLSVGVYDPDLISLFYIPEQVIRYLDVYQKYDFNQLMSQSHLATDEGVEKYSKLVECEYGNIQIKPIAYHAKGIEGHSIRANLRTIDDVRMMNPRIRVFDIDGKSIGYGELQGFDTPLYWMSRGLESPVEIAILTRSPVRVGAKLFFFDHAGDQACSYVMTDKDFESNP